MPQPRIPPRPITEWDDEARGAFALLNTRKLPDGSTPPPIGDKPVPNMLGIFSWHPALTSSWLSFSQHIAASTLSVRDRELLILRTSWLRRGEWEWSQHVNYGRAAGLSDGELNAIIVGPDAPVWTPHDAALLRAVDEICRDRYISDATWQALAEDFDRKQLMDVVFTVGAYDLHCMAFNTFGLELEPEHCGFPDSTAT